MNKLIFAAAGVLALAGCKQETPAPAPTDTGTTAMAAATPTAAASTTMMTMESLTGTWDDTMADGSKATTEFKSDGTYKDTDAKGATETGTFAIKDGKVCTTPGEGDNKGKEQCWAVATAADGTMTATAEDGTVLTVKKRA